MTYQDVTDTKDSMTLVFDDDLLEAVCLCHAALAQDSPQDERFYLNQILGFMFGYLSQDGRRKVERYLAEKEYLGPAPKIEIAK